MTQSNIRSALGVLAVVFPVGVNSVVAEAPSVHALTGARIVVAPGQVIESGTIVLRDGVIEAVGADVSPPPDARVWELEGLTAYPGLIEPYSTRPWPEGGEEPGQDTQAGHENTMVRPERDMSLYAADAAGAEKLRSAGFTTALVAPAAGVFRGRSALVALGDGPPGANLLRRNVAQHIGLDRNRGDRRYPNSQMGTIALIRQTLLDTAWYRDARRAYEANPHQRRPAINTALETLANKTGPETYFFETGDLSETLRAGSLIEEFGLRAVIVGSGEEYRRPQSIAALGVPLLVPLDFPEPPTVSDEDDLTVDLEELRHWDNAPENPHILLGNGVSVALTTHGMADPKKALANVAIAIERGLAPDAALAALTTTPAGLLGIADRVGSLEPGKNANLVIVEGEIFAKKPEIREVWIDGRRYEAKKSKPAEIEPAGTWELDITTGDGQELARVLTVTGVVPRLGGTIGTASGTGIELSSISVSGKTLRVSFDGSPLGIPGVIGAIGAIEFELEIDGDSVRGSGTSTMGPFTVNGSRTEQPGPPEAYEAEARR